MPCSHWPLMSVCIVKIKANWHTGAALNANELMGKEGSAPGSSRQLSKDGVYVVLSGLKSSLVHGDPDLNNSAIIPQTNSNHSNVTAPCRDFFGGRERMVKGSYCQENGKKLLI